MNLEQKISSSQIFKTGGTMKICKSDTTFNNFRKHYQPHNTFSENSAFLKGTSQLTSEFLSIESALERSQDIMIYIKNVLKKET